MYAKEHQVNYHGIDKKQRKEIRAKKHAQATDNDYATVARSWDEYLSLAEEAIFEYAFRLGARLTMEVQKDT